MIQQGIDQESHNRIALLSRAIRNILAWLGRATLTLTTLMAFGAAVMAQANSANQTTQETTMTMHASGVFEVKVIPQKPDNEEARSANLGRFSLDKQFHGDLEGTSKGEMLSAMGEVKESGAYVAIERITGTLHGKSGSFALYHNGAMRAGQQILNVTVVPDSGTGQLTGLSGTLQIKIVDRKHFYEFEYQLSP